MSLKNLQTNRMKRINLKGKSEKAVNEFASLVIHNLKEKLKELILFGSKARGDFKKDSDIDIFVLIDKENLKIWQIIQSLSAKVSLKFDVVISALVMDKKRYQTHLKLKTLLYKNIIRDGVLLWKRK